MMAAEVTFSTSAAVRQRGQCVTRCVRLRHAAERPTAADSSEAGSRIFVGLASAHCLPCIGKAGTKTPYGGDSALITEKGSVVDRTEGW